MADHPVRFVDRHSDQTRHVVAQPDAAPEHLAHEGDHQHGDEREGGEGQLEDRRRRARVGQAARGVDRVVGEALGDLSQRATDAEIRAVRLIRRTFSLVNGSPAWVVRRSWKSSQATAMVMAAMSRSGRA